MLKMLNSFIRGIRNYISILAKMFKQKDYSPRGSINSSSDRRRRPHLKNYGFISFHIEWDMIEETVFLSILKQMEFHLVQNRKENCLHDYIPFKVKENENIVYSMQGDTLASVLR